MSQHNPPLSDIGQAITGSVSRDGLGAMRAPLSMGGNKLTNMATGTEPADAVTFAQLRATANVPVGAVMDYAGTTAPNGWLVCAGQSLNRGDYPDLFAVLGATYGSVSGTTFSLPDCRGRVIAGIDLNVGSGVSGRLTATTMTPDGASFGAVGGVQEVALNQDQMPAHVHDVTGTTSTDGSHTHGVPIGGRSGLAGGGSQTAVDAGSGITTSAGGSHSHTVTATAASTGGGGAHSNVQPTILMSKIIKATANG